MGSGISVDSWVKIEGHCDVEYEVVGDETQFRFGGRSHGLDLIITEDGLATLVQKCTEALTQMRLEYAQQYPEGDRHE